MDVYQIVTDRILSEMEHGIIPWVRPWVRVNDPAHNAVSGHQYSLLNRMLLLHSGAYATYDQWLKKGCQVRKGAKSEIVVFWKWPEKISPDISASEDLDKEETEHKTNRPVLRYYHVFHCTQVDGYKDPHAEEPLFDNDPIVKAEKVIEDYVSRTGIKWDVGKYDEAYYAPAEDRIHVPGIRQYEHCELYYSTAFHEMIHSTGTSDRLNRPGLKPSVFGSERYSREELVAEVGATALMGTIGIGTESSIVNSAAYCQSWLQAIKGDKHMIVVASGQAEKAARYILGTNCD